MRRLVSCRCRKDEVFTETGADDLQTDRQATVRNTGGHAHGGKVHQAGEEAQDHTHTAMDFGVTDHRGHRALGGEWRYRRHGREQQVDVVKESRYLDSQLAASGLGLGRLGQRPGKEVLPTRGTERIHFVEPLLVQFALDVNETVNAFDVGVRQ